MNKSASLFGLSCILGCHKLPTVSLKLANTLVSKNRKEEWVNGLKFIIPSILITEVVLYKFKLGK